MGPHRTGSKSLEVWEEDGWLQDAGLLATMRSCHDGARGRQIGSPVGYGIISHVILGKVTSFLWVQFSQLHYKQLD